MINRIIGSSFIHLIRTGIKLNQEKIAKSYKELDNKDEGMH